MEPKVWLAALGMAAATFALLALRQGLGVVRFAVTDTFGVALVGGMLLMAWLAERQAPAIVLLAGAGLAAGLSALGRATELTRVRLMIKRIGHPSHGDGAVRYLSDWARAHRPRPGATLDPVHATVVCTAAGAMLGKELPEAAERVLRTLPARVGSVGLAATHASLLAMSHVVRGQHEEAHAALRDAPEEVSEPLPARTLLAARALVAAIRGEVERAHACLGQIDGGEQLDGLVLTVRAHCAAADGRPDEARALLAQLAALGGDEALRRVRDHRGPASRLAEEVGGR